MTLQEFVFGSVLGGGVLPGAAGYLFTAAPTRLLEQRMARVAFSEAEVPEAYHPSSFESEIVETTERLKLELQQLHRQYGLLALAP